MSWSASVTGLVDIKFSNDSKKLATASMDSVIKIWSLETSRAQFNSRISSNDRCTRHECLEIGICWRRNRNMWIIRAYLILQYGYKGINKEIRSRGNIFCLSHSLQRLQPPSCRQQQRRSLYRQFSKEK